jgi:hypothetical protein
MRFTFVNGFTPSGFISSLREPYLSMEPTARNWAIVPTDIYLGEAAHEKTIDDYKRIESRSGMIR